MHRLGGYLLTRMDVGGVGRILVVNQNCIDSVGGLGAGWDGLGGGRGGTTDHPGGSKGPPPEGL